MFVYIYIYVCVCVRKILGGVCFFYLMLNKTFFQLRCHLFFGFLLKAILFLAFSLFVFQLFHNLLPKFLKKNYE